MPEIEEEKDICDNCGTEIDSDVYNDNGGLCDDCSSEEDEFGDDES